jgi:hypothetical protein
MLRRIFPLSAVGAALALAAGCALFQPATQPVVVEPAPPAAVQAADAPAPAPPQPEEPPPDDRIEAWAEQIARRDDIRARLDRDLPPSTSPLAGRTSRDFEPAPTEPERAPVAAPTIHVTAAAGAKEHEVGSGPDASAPRIMAQAAPRRAESALPPAREPAPPAVNAPQSAATPVSFATLVDQLPADDSPFRRQLDQRLLHVLAGDYGKARGPLEMAPKEQQAMAARIVEALIAIRETHGGDPAAETRRALEQIESLRSALLPGSELMIEQLAICRAVRGFGQFDEIEPAVFPAGRANEFVTYAEIRGFESERAESGEFESRFSMKTTVLNRIGDVALAIDDDSIIDRCRTRRRDCFIPRLVRLPATLPPGEYVVKTTIIDRIGQKVAERRVSLRLSASG